MNDTIKNILERRSIRKFKADMPSKSDINQIVEAGRYAANGIGEQGTITIAVTDPKMRKQIVKDNCEIGGWKDGFDPFYGAPVILIVLGNKNVRTSVYDGSLVIGNMMLAAHSLGLGSIWIHRAKEEFEMPKYKDLLSNLGIDGDWEGIGHCAVGYMDCDNPKAAKRRENTVFWI